MCPEQTVTHVSERSTELRTPGAAGRAPEAAASVCNRLLFDPMMRTSPSATSTRWASAQRWSRRQPPPAIRIRCRAVAANFRTMAEVMV